MVEKYNIRTDLAIEKIRSGLNQIMWRYQGVVLEEAYDED